MNKNNKRKQNANQTHERYVQRMDNVSIKWKLFSYLVFFVTIPIAIIWIFQIAFMETFYVNIKTNEVQTSADNIIANLDNANIAYLAENIARQNGYNVYLFSMDDADYQVIYDALYGPGSKLKDMSVEQFKELCAKALENGGSSFEVYSDPPVADDITGHGFVGELPRTNVHPGKTVISVNIVDTNIGKVGLMIHASVTPVNSTVYTLRVQLIYITLILITLCLFIALIMSRHISYPIIQTNTFAKKLAKGDYSTKFTAHGYREIRELNNTLNYTASELSKVEKLRQELIANVSHDLRTPLTLISGYSEMMRDIPDENTPENAQVIIDEVSRLSGLVNDMLDISRIQSGSQKIEPVPFDLTASVRDIMERYAKLVEQDGYVITFAADKDVYVTADPDRISQVIYNLINNAVNYTGEDKTVAVRQTVANGKVRIDVTDTGMGIEPEEVPYIWDRYYKVDKTHKRAAIGSGLGLSIVRGILEMHHAKYGVSSEVGKGSTFWFELDVAPDNEKKK